MEEGQRAKMKELLHREPCPLLALSLSHCKVGDAPCFQGQTVGDLLQPPTGKPACWRLRTLELSGCGLTGDLAAAASALLE